MDNNEHHVIKTGYERDWEGRERAFVALEVRYGEDYRYHEKERWWFGDFEPGNLDNESDPAIRAKIRELMDQCFRDG